MMTANKNWVEDWKSGFLKTQGILFSPFTHDQSDDQNEDEVQSYDQVVWPSDAFKGWFRHSSTKSPDVLEKNTLFVFFIE